MTPKHTERTDATDDRLTDRPRTRTAPGPDRDPSTGRRVYIAALQAQIRRLEQERDGLDDGVSALETDVDELEREIASLKRELRRSEDRLGTVVDRCERVLDEKRESYRSRIAELQRDAALDGTDDRSPLIAVARLTDGVERVDPR